jgi:peroxiredoxin
MRSDIKTGGFFPDYELPDQTNSLRKLSYLQGNDPMILTLNRGSYCPKDHQQLQQLAAFSSQCTVGYVRIVTITADPLRKSNELRLALGADWTFLHDEKRIIQKDLDIAEYTDPVNNPMIPYTLILSPGLRIEKIYNGYWYWGRPSTSELHQDLREVTRSIRPDWQIDTQEMREKFDRGQKDNFFPYGEPYRHILARMNNVVDQFNN